MPEDTQYASFDQKAIDEALALTKTSGAESLTAATGAGAAAKIKFPDSGQMSMTAQCITVTVKNSKVCLNVPFAGSICIGVPKWVPNGKAVAACASVCTRFGVPTGVTVTLSIGGQQIL